MVIRIILEAVHSAVSKLLDKEQDHNAYCNSHGARFFPSKILKALKRVHNNMLYKLSLSKIQHILMHLSFLDREF